MFFDKTEQLKESKIFIDNDLNEIQRRDKKKLLEKQNILKSHKIQSKISKYKLIVDNKRFDVNELLKLIPDEEEDSEEDSDVSVMSHASRK